MGPPGGGRNDVTSRFTRHLNVIGIDEFQDDVLNKIFGAIVDWHFAKGFDSAVARFGRVREREGWEEYEGRGTLEDRG